MPTFEFTDPNGKEYSVDGPDGATKEQAFAILQQHLGGQKATIGPKAPVNTASGLARSAAEGIPILGGLANKAEAGLEAAVAPYVEPLLPEGVDQRINAPTFGERYNKALGIQNAMDESFAWQHPAEKTTSEIAGGIASTGGAALTGIGAKLLGLGAETLPGMMGQGALSGGAIGAADAAVRGGNPVLGAGLGAVAGAVGPAIGRGLGAAGGLVKDAISPVSRLASAAKRPEEEAARQVAEAAQQGLKAGTTPMTRAEISAAHAADQPVTVMDAIGRPGLRLARTAANFSPEAQEALTKTIGGRFRTQGDRLTDWLGSKFNYPDVPATEKALDEAAKTVNRSAYAKAYAQGANGIWHEGFEQISQAPVVKDAIRKAMVSAKNEAARQGFTPPKNPFMEDESGRFTLKTDANGNKMLPNLQFWDIVKRNLDRTGTREAKDWSRILREHLDEQVPSYANARAGAAKFFGAENALEAGQEAVASRLKNREMAEGLAKMSPVEKKLFQDGFVDRYVQTIRETSDRRNVLDKIGASKASRDRLNIALGPERARELEAFLRVEDVMDRARTAMGNSTTAQQLGDMAKGAFDLTNPKAMLIKAFHGAMKAAGQGVNEKVAQKIADMLTSSKQEDIDKALKMVAKNKTLMDALRRPIAVGGALGARSAIAPLARPSQDQGNP